MNWGLLTPSPTLLRQYCKNLFLHQDQVSQCSESLWPFFAGTHRRPRQRITTPRVFCKMYAWSSGEHNCTCQCMLLTPHILDHTWSSPAHTNQSDNLLAPLASKAWEPILSANNYFLLTNCTCTCDFASTWCNYTEQAFPYCSTSEEPTFSFLPPSESASLTKVHVCLINSKQECSALEGTTEVF